MSSSSDLIDAELNLAGVRTERLQAAYNFDLLLAQLLETAGISDEFPAYARRSDARPVLFDKNKTENMKRSNIIGIIAAAVVIIVSVVLISWYLRRSTPTLIQGTVECTTYKASSKVPGRIDDMKVEQGDRVEKGQLLYTLSTPELEAKLQQAEAVKSAAAALDQAAIAGARIQQIEAAMNMWEKAQAGLELARKTYERVKTSTSRA